MHLHLCMHVCIHAICVWAHCVLTDVHARVHTLALSPIDSPLHLHSLRRFYAPNEGQLLLDGTDIRDLDPALLTREIALVGQVRR